MAIAQSMITEGNKRLAPAVSKKDMNEIATQKLFGSNQKSIASVLERHANGRNMKTYIKK